MSEIICTFTHEMKRGDKNVGESAKKMMLEFM
jgi:hypothetical protein